VIAQLWRIARKDLHSELRTKEALNAALSLTVVLLLLFSFAFDPVADEGKQWSGGLLWLVYSFAGALIVNRGFARELTNDCLEALRASPVSASALFMGKTLAAFLILLGVELIALIPFSVFYDAGFGGHWGTLAAVLALTTWGVTVVGTMFSALTVNLHLRELMLPVLVYPMLIPALVAAIEITRGLISGTAFDPVWFRLLISFDIIFTALALMLAEVVLVE